MDLKKEYEAKVEALCNQKVLDKELIDACKRSESLSVIKRLVEDGANVNTSTKHGYTPLHYAIDENNIEIVRFLIEQGADVNAMVERVASPLLSAILQGDEDMIKLIIYSGADIIPSNFNAFSSLKYAVRLLISKMYTEFLIQDAEKNKQ